MMRKIRLLIVDDHALFRESLGRFLESVPEFSVIGQSATVANAIEILSQRPADVILLDYDLGEVTGTRFFDELKHSRQNAKVLMVTAGLSDEVTLRVMEGGASGIFLKHNSAEQIVAAIARVAEGEIWLDNAALQGLISGRRAHNEPSSEAHHLTARQSEVLKGILDGLANKEIAWKLKASESSIKAVIQELFRKAGVRTRSQLVRIAIEKHSSDWLKSSLPDN